MTDGLTVRLSRHDATEAAAMRDTLVAVYVESYGAARDLTDPFFTPQAFSDRLDLHLSRPGFTLTLARAGEEAVGYVYGYPLPPQTRWFHGITPELPGPLRRALAAGEILAINEIMVRPRCQRRGIAAACHAAYLANRPHRYATLLVAPDNTPAYTAYRSWGYRKIGVITPHPDHRFDSLALPLADRSDQPSATP